MDEQPTVFEAAKESKFSTAHEITSELYTKGYSLTEIFQWLCAPHTQGGQQRDPENAFTFLPVPVRVSESDLTIPIEVAKTLRSVGKLSDEQITNTMRYSGFVEDDDEMALVLREPPPSYKTASELKAEKDAKGKEWKP